MQCSSSLSLTDSVGEQHYVLQLELLPTHTMLASLSTGGLKFVQVGPAGLQAQGQAFQFTERVSDMHARPALGNPSLFQTSSVDGYVRVRTQ